MSMVVMKTFGLMGQPNTGKSTVFNALTGSRQHVGNWPGKTVERKEGYFTIGSKQYRILDLPGTYSLRANSDEEVITRDAIVNDEIDMILAILDASQLERSMFLLSDYAGIERPIVILLNMVDVAEEQGKIIDSKAISAALGVPVLPVTAVRKDGLAPLIKMLESGGITGGHLDAGKLEILYKEAFGVKWDELMECLPDLPGRSRVWTGVKLLEGDSQVLARVIEKTENWAEVEALLSALSTQKDGLLIASDCKFRWIHSIVEEAVVAPFGAHPRRGWFDRLATSRFWGKLIAVCAIIGALICSQLIGGPFTFSLLLSMGTVSADLASALNAIHITPFLVSLICDAILPGAIMALGMSFYVAAISLCFGFLEEIGYMARIAYVFDSSMQRLGLHGKAIMPFLVSFGCNIGGVAGTSVIDSWRQRMLAISISLVIPCGSVWGVVALMGYTFFGNNTVWIILALFGVALLHMYITSKIFGYLFLSEGDRTGLIMELPPYHKPNPWLLFRFVWQRMSDVLFRALRLIILVAVVFWALSYSPGGDITRSVVYIVGKFIEPITLWFGLTWQLFIAFVISGLGKEASLGVIGALFSATGEGVNLAGLAVQEAGVMGDFTANLLASVTKPQALAFIFGFFFNMPCVVTMGAMASATHSIKWTMRIAFYYIGMALLMSFAAYHVGRLIF
ncbi:MAG: ferrous iron transport protein B [Synergistaceae bacterium]|jgi:ferrous iron transport protein B|nr:ferrous iron transport protein B [Synergistaceae bacterium]